MIWTPGIEDDRAIGVPNFYMFLWKTGLCATPSDVEPLSAAAPGDGFGTAVLREMVRSHLAFSS